MPRGYNALGDILGTTADGVDLNQLWNEAQQAVQQRNASRNRFVDLLTYRVTKPTDQVLQVGDTSDIVMEPASEYGLPVGARPTGAFLTMGATGSWFDLATKFTYRALADMTGAQVQAVTNAALEADNKLLYSTVMNRLFQSQNTAFVDNGNTYQAYAFWNGDGNVPPPWNGNTFLGTHNHFRTSGAATINSGDLDEIISDFKSHGFSAAEGAQIVILCNPAQGATISTFRVASGAAEDFVPAQGARFFTADHLLGEQPAPTWGGFAVKGAYGEALIIEDTRIPSGYIVGLTSGGQNVPTNPIMLREHPKLTGLQIIPGNNAAYPLVDSYFCHFVGAGVRQRGAALVMQITANASYTAPATLAI